MNVIITCIFFFPFSAKSQIELQLDITSIHTYIFYLLPLYVQDFPFICLGGAGGGGIILPHFKCCCLISSVTLHDEGEEGRTRGASWQQKFSSLTFDGHFPSSIAAVLAIHAVPRPLVSQGPWCQVQPVRWTALADL